MTKTANSYLADSGELTITITADDATAMSSTFPTIVSDEDVTLDPVVRMLTESQPETRQYSEVYVTGDVTPLLTMSDKRSSSKWTLTLVDDYSSGGTGEFSTDNVAALEIFEAFRNAGRTVSQMTVTPAGAASPAIETTMVNVEIESITHPEYNADATAPNETVVMLVVESFSKAAHA